MSYQLPCIVLEGEQCQITPDGVMLVGEWGSRLTVECGCGTGVQVVACADEPLSAEACDELLDAWLLERGWRLAGYGIDAVDVCPACAQHVEVP